LKIIVARRMRPVPREQLMELLWPDADPVRAGNRLSVLLSTLRAVLQPGQGGVGDAAGLSNGGADGGPLRSDGSGVWLDRALVEVDVEHFLRRAKAALDAHRRGHPDAVAGLVAAEAAHTGEFLEDDPYEEWAASVAEEVHATHVALLRALVSRLRRAGEVDEVVRYLLRLLDKDRFDEHAHLGLVRLLLAAGRHGEARRRYRIYQRAMAELGIAPQPLQAGQEHDPAPAAGGCVVS
jgi:DNA-binding SARP family transcriptional activator